MKQLTLILATSALSLAAYLWCPLAMAVTVPAQVWAAVTDLFDKPV